MSVMTLKSTAAPHGDVDPIPRFIRLSDVSRCAGRSLMWPWPVRCVHSDCEWPGDAFVRYPDAEVAPRKSPPSRPRDGR